MQFKLADPKSRRQDSPMQTLNQEISFEVAKKNETATVAKPPALADKLPPLTEQQRKDLATAHPSLQARIERSMRQKNQREQQWPTPPNNPKPTTTSTNNNHLKLKPEHEEALKNAKSQKEREEILTLIHAHERAKQRNQQAQQFTNQRTPIQQNQKTTSPARASKLKKRRAPLSILQAIRFKTGAKYDLIAAERIVAHICRRQGNKKNQQRRGCFETIPHMAKACRIRINRFRKLLSWLTKAGILIAEYREHQPNKYTVAPGRQMIMPMIIDDLKLTPSQNAVARIMLRYGIISIRQAAKLAHTSARTASRTAKLLEEKEVVNVRRIQGYTNEYQFCRKVLKFLKRTVAKKTRGLLPKGHPLRNFRGRLSQLRTHRAIHQAQKRAQERRIAWEKANPKLAAIQKAINEQGKATGNYFQAFKDHFELLKATPEGI